jgi:FlaA1/EpsC-like NDP-sugar epimerase
MIFLEAARLVLQAATIGESRQVLVLDMGEPVRIVDLARGTSSAWRDKRRTKSRSSSLPCDPRDREPRHQ